MGGEKNLKPPRTTEEARKRGRNGGIKSGEARRRKRDAKSAARMILNLPASEINERNLRAMGIDVEDFTNMVAVMARAFSKAMTGDVGAMNFLIETAAISPRAKMAEERHKRDMKAGTQTTSIIDDWISCIPDVETEYPTGGGEDGK